jgi:hypothetical protein
MTLRRKSLAYAMSEVSMKFLFRMVMLFVLAAFIPAQAVELKPLADCSIHVFREINRSHAWSGKQPKGCNAEVYVEKRPEGIFVTAWISSSSERGWERVSLSAAMGFFEVADRKTLEKAGRDITARAARIERCLDSIIRVNDPLECRDYATKTFSAGEETGIEYKRSIWLDDNGRHSVVEYAYGDASVSVSPPAELFGGAALPPGMELNIHFLDTE